MRYDALISRLKGLVPEDITFVIDDGSSTAVSPLGEAGGIVVEFRAVFRPDFAGLPNRIAWPIGAEGNQTERARWVQPRPVRIARPDDPYSTERLEAAGYIVMTADRLAAIGPVEMAPIIATLRTRVAKCVEDNRREAERVRAHPLNAAILGQIEREASIQGAYPTEEVDAWIIDRMGYDPEDLDDWGKPTRRDRRRIARSLMAQQASPDRDSLLAIVARANGAGWKERAEKVAMEILGSAGTS